MDFSPTAEQVAFQESVRRFATAKLAGQRSAPSGFDLGAWQECARFGMTGLAVPRDYGGGDADPLTVALALETLGKHCPDSGLLFALNAQMWACQHPLVRFGTPEQKARFLPRMCAGDLIAAHAMSEPESGSDAFALRTTARRESGRWRLDGSKTFVTNGPIAGLFLVFAAADPSRVMASLNAFLLPLGTPGLTIGPNVAVTGGSSATMCDVYLQDCVVGDEDLLGSPGAGVAIFNSSMKWERTLILASVVGRLERQLDEVLEQAQLRRRFGRPLGEFQAVSHRLSRMKLRLETSRLMLRRAAWALRSDKRSVALFSALAKLHISEAFVLSTLDAAQLLGGASFVSGSDTMTSLVDAAASRIYSGTSEMLLNLVAADLGVVR